MPLTIGFVKSRHFGLILSISDPTNSLKAFSRCSLANALAVVRSLRRICIARLRLGSPLSFWLVCSVTSQSIIFSDTEQTYGRPNRLRSANKLAENVEIPVKLVAKSVFRIN